MIFCIQRLSLLLILLLAGSPGILAQQLSAMVEAGLTPDTVAVGESASLRLIITGSAQTPAPMFPEVEGLRFEDNPSTQRSISIINGQTSERTTYSWPVRALDAGEYTIPAFAVNIGGRSITVPAQRLNVVTQEEKYGNAFFVRFRPGIEDPYYVGQVIPGFFEFWIQNGLNFSLRALPEKIGDGFTAEGLDGQPDSREIRQKGGRDYQVFTWPVNLTPIKAGSLDLQFNLPLIVEIPDRERSGNQYYDPFFGGSIFSRRNTRQHSIDLTGARRIFEVSSLPRSTQPASFTGGIGDFDISRSVSPARLKVGDPLTLTVTIEGTGNFERFGEPVIELGGDFRAYPPKSHFEPLGALGYKGRKTIEYILVPLDDSIEATPEIPVAYFDPFEQRYRERSIRPAPIEVSPPDPGSLSPPGRLTGAGNRSARGDEALSEDRPPDILGLQVVPGSWRTPGPPLHLQSVFWTAQSGPAALLALAAILVGIQRRRGDDRTRALRQLRKRVRASMSRAEQALRAGLTGEAVTAAEEALQTWICFHRATPNREPRTVDETDAEPLLVEIGCTAAERDEALAAFRHAAAFRYGGLSPEPNAAESTVNAVRRVQDRVLTGGNR